MEESKVAGMHGCTFEDPKDIHDGECIDGHASSETPTHITRAEGVANGEDGLEGGDPAQGFPELEEAASRSSSWQCLPNEILDAIFDCCCDVKDVISLACTCKGSLSAARRRLYSELTFDSQKSHIMFILSQRATEIKSFSDLVRTLRSQPEIAGMVRKAHLGRRGASQQEAGAISEIMDLLSQQPGFQGMYVQAWQGMPVNQEAPPNIIELSMQENFRAGNIDHKLCNRLGPILQIPSLLSITFGNDLLDDSEEETPALSSGQLSRGPWCSEQQVTPTSNVCELKFHYGSVPAPQTLNHIMSRIKSLRYLFIEFCSCSYQIWDRQCLAKLLVCLDHHEKSLETLCLDVTWAAFTTYETCSLVQMQNLHFLRINLDFLFPWKAVSGRHPPPLDPRIRPVHQMIPTSLETLVLKMCHSFWWIDSSEPEDAPDASSVSELAAHDDMVPEQLEIELATEQETDVDQELDQQQDLKLTPEASALLSWLGDIAMNRAKLPNLKAVVIVGTCPFRQHHEVGIRYPHDWAQLQGVVQLSSDLLENGIQLEFG